MASLVGAPCEGGSVVVVVVDVLNEKSSGVPPNMASHCSRVYMKNQQSIENSKYNFPDILFLALRALL